MKKLILLSAMLLCGFQLMAQGNFQVVQSQKAHYAAGEVALQEYFNLNLKYPAAALEKRVYGSVMLSYDVMPDSTLSNIVILSGVGYGVDEEVVKLIKPLKFSPAISNGVTIRSNMIITINVKAIPRPELEIEK